MAKDTIDADIALDAVDAYKRAISSAFTGQQPELEAIASAEIAKVWLNSFQLNDKAKKYISDAVRILESLKPRIFNTESWHQEMMKNMDSINKAELDKEKAEEDKIDAEMR